MCRYALFPFRDLIASYFSLLYGLFHHIDDAKGIAQEIMKYMEKTNAKK